MIKNTFTKKKDDRPTVILSVSVFPVLGCLHYDDRVHVHLRRTSLESIEKYSNYV